MVETVLKPWGREEIWAHTDKYVGKILYINAGEQLSLQYHNVKDETIMVMSGTLMLQIGEDNYTLCVGETYHIAPKIIHRMKATTDCKIMEVSTPELDDVVRLEDSYGRVDGT